MLFFQSTTFFYNMFKSSYPVSLILEISMSIASDLAVRFYRNSLSFYKDCVLLTCLTRWTSFFLLLLNENLHRVHKPIGGDLKMI